MLKKLAKLCDPESIAQRAVKALLFAGSVTLGAASFSNVAGAADVKLKIFRFDVAAVPLQSTINVTSSDGARWDTIAPGEVAVRFNSRLQTCYPGYVAEVGIWLGSCSNDECNAQPRVWSQYLDTRDFKQRDRVKHRSTSIFGANTVGLPSIGNDILNLCNNNLALGGTSREHTFDHPVVFSMTADTRIERGGVSDISEGGGGPKSINADTTRGSETSFKIKCLPFVEVEEVQAPPEPYSVDLQVTQQGETCPKKTEVRAIIKYAGPATARFRFKLDGKLSRLHTIKARKLAGKPRPGVPGGGHTYLVERIKTYYLDPGQHNFRIEVRGGKKSHVKTVNISCPPFKVTEAWLNYRVQNTPVCSKNVKEVATFKATRPGQAPFAIKTQGTQGGLVVNSGTAIFKRKGREYVATIKRKTQMSAFESYMSSEITNPSLTSPGATGSAYLKVDCLELSGGDFSFIDNTGTRCPREGKALINFSMNIQKDIRYKFDCSHGNFSGMAKAVPGNNGGFVAPALVKFNIDETTHANCRLSSVVAGQTKIHTLKGHVFKCIKRTTDPVTGDLSGGANPTPTEPTIPDVVVADPSTPPVPPVNVVPGIIADPVRTVSCTGGIVRNRSCYCPRTHKKVSVGPNAWRCVRKMVVDPVRPGGQTGTPGASPDTKPVSGQPTRANPTATGGQPTRANPDADKRRLDELKKKQAEQKRAAELVAKRKAAAAAAVAAKKKAAAAAKKKAAAAAKKKAAAAAKKKSAAAAKKKAAAAAKKKAAAAAKKKAAAAAKKKGKKKGKGFVAQ